jgi:MFS transporter, Spinster family, sphingosine-1-phosphate transporter
MASPSPETARPVRGAYPALALLFVINMLNYIDRYNLAAVEEVARQELLPNNDNALTLMGVLLGSFMITYMLTAPLFGWLSDRHSRWKLIAIGITLWSVATAASGFATGFWSMLLCRCLVGVGEAAYAPAAPAILADLFPLRLRGKAIAVFYVAIPVGSALSFVIGGQILHAMHGEWGYSGWRWVFFLMLPPGLVLALVCLFMREPRRGEVEGEAALQARHSPTWADYKVILRTRSFLFCTLGMTAMTFALGGIVNWMPTYLLTRERQELVQVPQQVEEHLKDVNQRFGMIVVASGLLSTILGGWLADVFRRRWKGAYFKVSSLGMFIGFFFFIAVLYTPFPLSWWLLFLTVMCLFLNTGPANTVLSNVVHPCMRQMAVAMNILVIHAFGDVISPTIIGAIAGPEKNFKLAFLVVSGMILLSGIFWWLGARYLEEDTAAAPTRLASSSSTPHDPPRNFQ